jgi:transcriptional regulator with XRE-family HTH domain
MFSSRIVPHLSLHFLKQLRKKKENIGGADKLSPYEERNPLRIWRLKQPPEGWRRSVLARQLGVSHTSVEGWEKGKRLPVVDAFAKIEKLTGISTQQWMNWYNEKGKERTSHRGRSV